MSWRPSSLRIRKAINAKAAPVSQRVPLSTTVVISLVSLLAGSVLTVVTSSVSTVMTAQKENVVERRSQLRSLLENAYGLRLEIASTSTKLWALAGEPIAKQDLTSLRRQRMTDFLTTFQGERINRFTSMGRVHFPELDTEVEVVRTAYFGALKKAADCSIDSAIEKSKEKSNRKISLLDFAPTFDCMVESNRLTEQIDNRVHDLANASRRKLAVFVVDPDRTQR